MLFTFITNLAHMKSLERDTITFIFKGIQVTVQVLLYSRLEKSIAAGLASRALSKSEGQEAVKEPRPRSL